MRRAATVRRARAAPLAGTVTGNADPCAEVSETQGAERRRQGAVRGMRHPVRRAEHMRRSITPMLLATALAVGGCASAFQQPEIRFEGLRVGSLGLRGGLLYAQLHVTNPNRFGFQTSRMTYDLELRAPRSGEDGERWVRVAQGSFDDPVSVPGGTGRLVEIPIEFTYAGLEGALRSVLDQGTVSYRVAGVVNVVDPVRRQVPYRRSGVVSVTGSR